MALPKRQGLLGLDLLSRDGDSDSIICSPPPILVLAGTKLCGACSTIPQKMLGLNPEGCGVGKGDE